jgi:cell shape-determining protein MreD
LLFIISLNGISVVDFEFFSINLHYILIYYWVLRLPRALGYGFIFLSGIITDVIFGLPMGSSPLALLVVAAVAAYVRMVTVRISLLNDWISFIPALLFANFIFFLTLYFSHYSIDYLYLFKNSIFTFIFYPILWSG